MFSPRSNSISLGLILSALLFFGTGASAVTWSTCPAITGGSDSSADCTTLQVPLAWNSLAGATIPYFVKRIIGRDKTKPHKQVWLIAGGPGYPGSVFEPMAQSWGAQDPTLDFYIPDHRGTGQSARLICPVTEQCSASPDGLHCVYSARNPLPLAPVNLWNQCVAEIQQQLGFGYLGNFTITAAAQDLDSAVRAMAAPGQPVYIFGGSYGTDLVQRFLQVTSAPISGVIIKGFSAAGLMDGTSWDADHNDIGQKIFAACAMDSTCQGKLGPNPWDKVTQLLATLKSQPNYCVMADNTPISYDKLRGMMALYMDVPAVRDTLPALVYRVARCSDADKAALVHFRLNFFQNATLQVNAPTTTPPVASEPQDSEIVQNVILASELIGLPVNLPKLAQIDGTLNVSARLGLSLGVEAGNPGTLYPRDSYYGSYPIVRAPMLMLNGDLDPSTPIQFAEQVASVYQSQSPTHYFFRVPRGGHTGETDPTCTPSLMEQFVSNPSVAPDASCLANQPPLDFVHAADGIASKLFGVSDLWD